MKGTLGFSIEKEIVCLLAKIEVEKRIRFVQVKRRESVLLAKDNMENESQFCQAKGR